jgi:hypothetical protein
LIGTPMPERQSIRLFALVAFVALLGQASEPRAMAATFGEDLSFLRRHTEIILLQDAAGAAEVAVSPSWQGRVLTSTAQHDGGRSFGWINRELIASGKLMPHINVFGGEDRVWLGPEGGQFSVFFATGAPFDLEHWYVPAPLDTLPFKTISRSRAHVAFQAQFTLTNYSGTAFDVELQRDIRILDRTAAWRTLGLAPRPAVSLVAYESKSTLINAGKEPWRKETGLLSVWILGMFNASPAATIVVPIKPGPETELGVRVTSNYFGVIPQERFKVTESATFLRGDAKLRSKIGISPKRSLGRLGSYDADHRILTIVEFNQPDGVDQYVNSQWKLQDNPFAGDAINSYNDGPPTPGAKQLGSFFEMESSSPAAALEPGDRIEHTHRTFHLIGSQAALDDVARTVLGVSLAQITSALPPP